MSSVVMNVYGEYKERYCEKCCGCNGNTMSGAITKPEKVTKEQIFMCATVRNVVR